MSEAQAKPRLSQEELRDQVTTQITATCTA